MQERQLVRSLKVSCAVASVTTCPLRGIEVLSSDLQRLELWMQDSRWSRCPALAWLTRAVLGRNAQAHRLACVGFPILLLSCRVGQLGTLETKGDWIGRKPRNIPWPGRKDDEGLFALQHLLSEARKRVADAFLRLLPMGSHDRGFRSRRDWAHRLGQQ